MYNKFRAKSKNTGRWVYGSLYHSDYADLILSGNTETVVDPDTVCVCINFKDSTRTDIYSGDIIQFVNHDELYLVWFCSEVPGLEAVRLCSGAYFNGYDYHNDEHKIDFSEFGLMLQDPYGDFGTSGIHVVGNCFDNPELLTCVERLQQRQELKFQAVLLYINLCKYLIYIEEKYESYFHEGRKGII